ncbi:MAG TPA: sigma-70 family RNA polymerase sigma factor [Pyrinomonadaceae bacterium]|nr:sigma-70 family RNA polymerase sigma factor [Pyrinomonadaceae bacterium]
MYEVETAAEMLLMVGQNRPEEARSESFDSPSVTLVRQVLRGDRDSFGRLYSLYAPMVHGILLARVPAVEVDDLVQEVFLQALRKLSTLRDAKAFGGWLAMITRNRAMDFHRRRRAGEELTEEIAAQPGERRNEAVEVLEIIRSLPEAYRETLVLRLVEGMTGPEIAVRTGLTPDSVRVNLSRGMKLLREKFKEGAGR